jgi:hypothetical protein
VAAHPYSSAVAEDHQGADVRYLALVILLVLALAGCSAPPSPTGAAALAAKICNSPITNSPDALAQHEVSCPSLDGGWV